MFDFAIAGASHLFHLYWESAKPEPPRSRPMHHYGFMAELSSRLAQDTYHAIYTAATTPPSKWSNRLSQAWIRFLTAKNPEITISTLPDAIVEFFGGVDPLPSWSLLNLGRIAPYFGMAHLRDSLSEEVANGRFVNPCLGHDLLLTIQVLADVQAVTLSRLGQLTESTGVLNPAGLKILHGFRLFMAAVMQSALRRALGRGIERSRAQSAASALQYLQSQWGPKGEHLDAIE